VVHLTPGGPLARVTVATPVYGYDAPICPSSLSNSLAYDKRRDLLYLAYNTLASGHCDTMLASSRDGGRTWSRPHKLLGPREFNGSRYFPILSVNKNGVLGLLWRGKPRYSPDCWYFSTSLDGVRLDNYVSLSHCVSDDSLKEQSSSYLATVIQRGRTDQAISVALLTFRDYLTRIGIVATSDGAFHPLWPAMEDGTGELRTARVQLRQWSRPKRIEAPHAPVLSEVTNKITVLYGGHQRLDHETNSVALDVSFRNDGRTPIFGPIYLRVQKAASDFGDVRLLNGSPALPLGSDYIDISPPMRSTVLAPGQTTSPYQLLFHFTSKKTLSRERYFVLKFKLRLFCQEREPISP
jgi:hypothetical protein